MIPEAKYRNIIEELELEKKESARLEKELEFIKLQLKELEETNNHLIAATWRERDLKKKLTETIGELNKTKLIVEAQNQRITESINYARKIQLAINPTESDLSSYFEQSFILYQPKDLISGDFPWIYHTEGHLYVAATDCTGHGVPGAMMSMIGNLLLNDIINNKKLPLPSEILLGLHKSVVNTLKQNTSESNSNDGMDIGLARIDLSTGKLVYSGAHRPLFHIRNNRTTVVSGDKFPIGGMHYKGLNTYTDQQIQLEKNDSLFLFTDGLPDQIGGPDRKKLMVKNFRDYLEKNASLEMAEIKTQLQNFIAHWQGTNKQIDDILVIGLRF